MAHKLDDIIETFQSVDAEMRGQLLLDFARRLPPLPTQFHEARDAGLNRVHECQTPVFLWVEHSNGDVRIYADVAEEAPTVKGFISILVRAFDGATREEVANIPSDLLERLGLNELIRMTRVVGLTAVLARIKSAAAKLES